MQLYFISYINIYWLLIYASKSQTYLICSKKDELSELQGVIWQHPCIFSLDRMVDQPQVLTDFSALYFLSVRHIFEIALFIQNTLLLVYVLVNFHFQWKSET